MTQCLVYSSAFSEIITSMSNRLELTKVNMTSILSIIIQIFVGIIVYIGILIALKDDYIYILINKIKNKFTKKKTA